jgi:methionyl-tRNA formyltransferase
VEIDARIRAFDPWPLCWTNHGEERLFILKAEPADPFPAPETGEADEAPNASEVSAPGTILGAHKRRGILEQTGRGILAVTELQYQAKKAHDWRAFLNGARNFMGSRLG